MAKMRIYVKETNSHTVLIDSDDFDLDEIKSNLDSELGDDYAGDFCDSRTSIDGEWELEGYEIFSDETNQSTSTNNT